MAKNEQKRIDLLKKIRADKTLISVSDVEDCFTSTLFMLTSKTKTFARVKAKLGDSDFSCMIHSLATSFLSSLYCTAPKDEKEQKRRMAEASDTNSDLLVGVVISAKVK